jgi:hypothetical protein
MYVVEYKRRQSSYFPLRRVNSKSEKGFG